MPNVMGREFPYTPEGMAAAEQYKQFMGMRDGGMLGFRPLQMQEGGSPELALVRQMLDLERSATTEEVAAFVRANAAALSEVAETLPQYSKYIGRMLDRFGGPPQVMPMGMSEEDLVGMKQMMPMGPQGMPQEQTPPFYMAPRYPGTAPAEMYKRAMYDRPEMEDSPRGSDIDYGRQTQDLLNRTGQSLGPDIIRRFEDARANLQRQTGGVPLGYTMGVESARVPGESLDRPFELRDGGIASLRRY